MDYLTVPGEDEADISHNCDCQFLVDFLVVFILLELSKYGLEGGLFEDVSVDGFAIVVYFENVNNHEVKDVAIVGMFVVEGSQNRLKIDVL